MYVIGEWNISGFSRTSHAASAEARAFFSEWKGKQNKTSSVDYADTQAQAKDRFPVKI